MRYILSARVWTAWELKSVIGLTTAQTYEAWARANGAEVLTDELPEGAKLHWIGPRRFDRVILYFSGTSTTYPGSKMFTDDGGGQVGGTCSHRERSTLTCCWLSRVNSKAQWASPCSTTVRLHATGVL